jgi:hypothetical protein
MQPWPIEAIQVLLETKVSEVEEDQRVHTSSSTYGKSRSHLIEKRCDGIQREQVDADEKGSKRVTLYTDEISALLKTLLTWYLEDTQGEQARKQSSNDLGDLDHPF